MDAETVKKNEEIMKKKMAALMAERKAKEKEDASKAPAGKGKKDAKKKKKWSIPTLHTPITLYHQVHSKLYLFFIKIHEG